jgi:hypothetical protein
MSLSPQSACRSPGSGPVYGRTRAGNPNRVGSAVRKATMSDTRPPGSVRTSRPPGMYAPAASSQRVAEREGADLVLALVPLGQRRHRVARVTGEHGDDRVDVARLPGVGPAGGDVIDGGAPTRAAASHSWHSAPWRPARSADPINAPALPCPPRTLPGTSTYPARTLLPRPHDPGVEVSTLKGHGPATLSNNRDTLKTAHAHPRRSLVS